MKVWELGNGAVSRLDVRDRAAVIQALNSATHETVHVRYSPKPTKWSFSTSWTRPGRCARTSRWGPTSGLLCGQWQGDAGVSAESAGEQGIARQAASVHGHDHHAEARFLVHLDEIRRLGYAVNYGEYRSELGVGGSDLRSHRFRGRGAGYIGPVAADDQEIDWRSGAASGQQCEADLVGTRRAPRSRHSVGRFGGPRDRAPRSPRLLANDPEGEHGAAKLEGPHDEAAGTVPEPGTLRRPDRDGPAVRCGAIVRAEGEASDESAFRYGQSIGPCGRANGTGSSRRHARVCGRPPRGDAARGGTGGSPRGLS